MKNATICLALFWTPIVAFASPLDELLPRPKEVRAGAGAALSCEGLPSGGYALRVRGENRGKVVLTVDGES